LTTLTEKSQAQTEAGATHSRGVEGGPQLQHVLSAERQAEGQTRTRRRMGSAGKRGRSLSFSRVSPPIPRLPDSHPGYLHLGCN